VNLRGSTIVADLTWTGARFERDVAIRVDENGRISHGSEAKAQESQPVVRLKGALCPGFVNAHSHAFQRGLRATRQLFNTGAGNFWTWRETMYRLADSLDVDSFYEESKRAFSEMLRAGMTTVGEFHYLHHETASWEFDDAVIVAAKDAGIRLSLIQTYYATGAIGKPLEGAQNRFGPLSRDEFQKSFSRIADKLDPNTQTLGLACHSIRAVSLDDVSYFRNMAAANCWPFHIHVEEVRGEIEDCLAVYGKRPMRVLLDSIRIDESVTAIHCTHCDGDDLREFASRGGRVCLCPITEGNLSDGFCDVPLLRNAGGQICFGTDCNIRLCAAEELRWLEFAQRLRREQRGVIVGEGGSSAAGLMQIGTINGANALNLPAGAIEAGRFADFFLLDLDHEDLRGVPDDALADAFLFGCGNGVIKQTFVGGRQMTRVG
jgi:formimidoylglutamate deiminase